MAYRFRLIILLFLSFFFNNSYALITVSEHTYTRTGDSGVYSSISDACLSLSGQYYTGNWGSYISQPSGYADQVLSCRVRSLTGSATYDIRFSIHPVCPANSSKVKYNTCRCASGFNEQGDKCVDPNAPPDPPDPCEALAEKCETLSGSLKVIDIKKSVDYRPFKTCTPAGLVPGCSKGCVIQSSGLGTYYKDQSGVSYFQGQGTVLSETCLPVVDAGGEPPKEEDNPLPPSEPDEKPCNPGEYQGTVNGTKVCLPAKSSETLVKQETVENADGSKTEVTTTVKCEGGKCTVTETATNKDSSGATTGTANKETGISQSNFCAQNPGSEVCKSAGDGEDDKSTFTGSCASNFKCEGDAVQCAIALQQHETSCKLFDESNPYWQAFKDAEAGNSTGVESTAVDLASHVSVDSVIGAGACPADIEITVFNQTVPFALSKFCPYFDAMGMLIMLGAAVGCLRILGSG